MDCPVCQTAMIKSKVGWLCAGCGNLVEPAHHHKAEPAARPGSTPVKATGRPAVVTDVKVKVHRHPAEPTL